MGSRVMDKDRKLRRYSRKDYSQVVSFPVEIVGRDGVVRRYSFEESVRLYQRRVASAGARYPDPDIARAEAEHCRRRIEQLRESYFSRYGWSDRQPAGADAQNSIGALAGEVAAFLRRCLQTPEDQRLDDLVLTALDIEDGEANEPPEIDRQILYAGLLGDDSRHLLYIYRFTAPANDPSREAFFLLLRSLQGQRQAGSSIEGLIAFHHTADCGLMLTGRGATASSIDVSDGAPPWMPEEDDARPDPLREGMLLLRRGEREEALRRFTRAYEENHYRRAAYIGAAVVADQLGDHGDAETAALMGSRYFPDDPALHYHLAIARLRRGSPQEAAQALERTRMLGGDRYGVQLLEALIALRGGRLFHGRRLLRKLSRQADSAEVDPALNQSTRWVRAQLAARSMLRGVGWAGIITGLIMVGMGMVWAIVLSMLSSLMLPGSHAAWQRQYHRLLDTPGSTGLRLADAHHLRQAFSTEQRPV